MKNVFMEQVSIFEKINLLKRELGLNNYDESSITKCYQICSLIETDKAKHYLDTNINDTLLFLSASECIKNNNGKVLGFLAKDSRLWSVDSIRTSKSTTVREDRIAQLFPQLSHYKFDLDLDDLVSVAVKSYSEMVSLIKAKKIKLDLVHLITEISMARIIEDIFDDINDDGIILLDKTDELIRNSLADFWKEKTVPLFECDNYAIYKKTNPALCDTVRLDHLRKKLLTIRENLRVIEMHSVPSITVGVVAYNIENYIQECLSSIVHQRGNFKMDVVIFEDSSTDATYQKIVDFMHNTKLPPNINIQLNQNKKNVGLVENYHLVISRAKEINNDFFALVDGDDYFINDERLQKHIEHLIANPDLALSFDGRILYDEGSDTYSIDDTKQRLTQSKYNFFDLAKNYFMGTGSVVRGNVVLQTPDELFNIFTADWFLHLFFSRYGDIGFIKKPMFVYRIHKQGDWSGRTTLFNARRLYKAIDDFNSLTNYVYYPYIFEHQAQLYNQKYNEPFENLDLLIIDDVFPHPSNGYRLQEFGSYLTHFEKIKILAAGVWTHLLGSDTNIEIIKRYKQDHRSVADKVVGWNGYSFNGNVSAKLAYICFLGNAYHCIELLESLNIPFVLELYPGGSFGLDNIQSDRMLERVLSSKCFRKVIVTQQATYDYLLKKNLCAKEEIINIFGVVMPVDDLTKEYKGKKHFGYQKKTLDICFVAMKYTKFGSDKGYDLFIEVAKKLVKSHKNIKFHVVGGFDEDVIDVSSLKNRITFYGHQKLDWFDAFYQDKDIILSPNINGLTHNGAFDGFPTAACTDAGLRETAIFCTDPLHLNKDHYLPGEEIEILEHNTAYIVERINYYYLNPDKLLALAQKGRKRIQQLYSYDAQMKPRIQLLDEEISKYPSWVDKSIAIKSGNMAEKANHPINQFGSSQPDKKIYYPVNKESLMQKAIRIIRKIYKRILIHQEVKLIRNSILFDEEWYLLNNPDVAAAKLDPCIHYLRHGACERRNPSRLFDSSWYLDTYPDVSRSGINPLVHYLRFGQFEGRSPQKNNLSEVY